MHIQDKINLSSINAKIISTYDRFTGSEQSGDSTNSDIYR